MRRHFSRYEVSLIALLTFLQFTIILDFMVLSPLSAILLSELHITTTQFGIVVSAYAWSAGVSGLLAAGFADRFDRKKMLIFFYAGFIIGTFFCGIATDYVFLLTARIVTGIFGGVIGSVIYAIVTDLFPLQVRGRVMGFLQMAFAGAAVFGLPVGLYLANILGWHAPFLMIAGLCTIIIAFIARTINPVDTHLAIQSDRNVGDHLIRTLSNPTYAKAFGLTVLIATAGFMLMPFGSAFAVYNNGISKDDLPFLYSVTGVVAMFTTPLIGKLSDRTGKFNVFCLCSALLILCVVIYCNLSITPLWIVTIFSVFMFATYAGRMVSSSALITAVPTAADRGAFMSINSSVNMVSGGIASLIAGTIVHQTQRGLIENYDILGYVVAVATVVSMGIMYIVNNIVAQKQQAISKD
jgi:predicted MFS family arabinose efflux permease